MPDFQAACLDTSASFNGTTYAQLKAALTTITNSHLNYTATLSELDCPHNANLKVVFFIADEAELVGDAAPVHADNYSNVLCRLRWPNLEIFEARGGHDILGLSQRSTNVPGVAGRVFKYVRRLTRQPSGGGAGPGWGNGDGFTHYDAEELPNVAWAAGGAAYQLCGPLIRERVHTPTSPHAAENLNDFPEGDFRADPLILYFDHRYDPGILACNLMSHSQVEQNWTQDGSDPNVWSKAGGAYGTFVWGVYLDPKKSTTGYFTENFLLAVDNEAECRATPWSWFKEGSGASTDVTWVNIPGGEDPRFRVGWTGFGTDPGYSLNDALLGGRTLRSRGIKVINAQMINMGSLGQLDTFFPESEWLGGRYLARSSFKPQTVLPGTKWGWSEDGEILWDTSDRPDADSDEFIQVLVNRHGSDYDTWKNRMHRFIEIQAAPEGIYEFGGGFVDKDGLTIQGALTKKIGNWEDPSRNMAGVGWTHFDAHHFGAQGVSNMSQSFLYMDRGEPDYTKQGVWEHFIINDLTNCQNAQNNLITDFVCRGGWIAHSGTGAYPRQNGTGLISNNVFRRGVVADHPIDPVDPPIFNGVAAGGMGVSHNWSAEIEMDEVTFLRVGNCLDGQANTDMVSDGGEGQNPLRGLRQGPLWNIHHSTFEDWGDENYDGRVYHMRQTGWHDGLDTVVSITTGAQTIVEVTGHGYPDIANAGVFQYPEIYFRNVVGPAAQLNLQNFMVEVIDANTFYLRDLVGAHIDSSGWPAFVSGQCARGCSGGLKTSNNTFIKAGIDADSIIFKYANGNRSLNDLQGIVPGWEQNLPGMADALYEAGSVINP